jgi:thiamine pyrophosphate-dependent acetolactate synthase large subunit-like protein
LNDNTRTGPRQEVPANAAKGAAAWGSDVVADMLRALGIPYLALNPGASYRGLHDSLVNHLGNRAPQMLLCLHEETAVSIAQGYAKASDRMMGAVLHSNVGLMHGSMSIFNAWCDRVPMLLLGATGPWDETRRRPWIDWTHTASDQGALVRDYTKWDNQPASIPAACEALLRAAQIAQTAPRGPTYVNLDAGLQETKLDAVPPLPDASRYAPPPAVMPSPDAVVQAVGLLNAADRPVILAGRVSRSVAGWKARVALAEKLQARVLTDLKMAAAFPTDHPLHAGPPGAFLSPEAGAVLREADVILALDWTDVAGTMKQAWGPATPTAKVINVSPDAHSHRGWSHDYQQLAPADAYLMCEPDAAVPLLLESARVHGKASLAPPAEDRLPKADVVSIRALAEVFNAAAGKLDICLTHVPLGWNGGYRHLRHPLDYIGLNGGGGVGAGPGITVGAALALKGSGRLAVGIVGDGDFLMANTAVWTACRYEIPCLILVANNRSFYNDELHQERVARARARPVENKWIGQRIADPDIDIAAMARSQGAQGIGPVDTMDKLRQAIADGLAAVQAGRVCVVDVRVQPGYDAGMVGAPAAGKR